MNDDELRRLMSDAVSDVEPQERLDAIRASVRSDQKVVPVTRSRSWGYAATGIVATAAVIGVVAFATGAVPGLEHSDDTPLGIAQSTPTQRTATEASSAPTAGATSAAPSATASTGSTASAQATGGPSAKAYAVYYVGTDPRGRPVLFREFHRGPDLPAADPGGNGGDVLTEAVHDALTTAPLDPDYVAPWAGLAKLDYASYETTGAGYTLQIALKDSAPAQRPADMSAAQARAAIQQLVYTAQAAVGARLPVVFTVGRHATSNPTLLGVDISQPVPAGKVLQTLSLVNISDPNNGQTVSGSLKVTGVNNAFEGSSVIYLERNGKHRLKSPVIGGQGGNKLWPWSVTLDLTKVKPGTYRLVAQNDDPSGRGKAPVDDRVIVVK